MKKVVIVFACGIIIDKPDQQTIWRLKKGLETFKKEGCDKIFVTGGTFCPGQKLPAAEVMKKWLIKNGVAEEKVIKDDKSVDTIENVNHCFNWLMTSAYRQAQIVSGSTMFDSPVDLLKGMGIPYIGEFMPDTIFAVSSWYHLLRIKFLFWTRKIKVKLVAAKGSLKSALYEPLFLLITILDPYGQGWINQLNKRRRNEKKS